jgi:hypothetical protein
MGAIPVKVTIEPSACNGEATWVRSGDQAWSKWYSSRGDAFIDAEQLGLADAQIFPNGTRLTQGIRRTVKEDAAADPDELIRFGFREAAANNLNT